MFGLQKRYVLALTFVAAYGVVRVTGQQTTAAGSYTAAQATAGRAVYQASCASCHNADLSGLNAPALAGLQFTGSWGERTTADLVAFMAGGLPPDNPGSLVEAAYLNLAAFILDTNGARAGNQPLTAATRVTIRTGATGQVRTLAQAGRARAAAGRGGQPPAPRGLLVPGEVKNYTNITDAMLRNPDPGDWIMIRHDYHANNYSTLNQITTGPCS